MKAKYILHGGYAGRVNKENDLFFKEILKDAPKDAKILLVYFAKEEGEYLRLETEDKAQFKNNKGDKNLHFGIAKEDTFKQQTEQADIIYLHGGGTLKLLKTLKQFSDIKGLFEGKIIAGESAGAYALSSCFFSKAEGAVFNGLGLVPVKTICHYEGVNQEGLEECVAGLETLLLADYKFKVFEI